MVVDYQDETREVSGHMVQVRSIVGKYTRDKMIDGCDQYAVEIVDCTRSPHGSFGVGEFAQYPDSRVVAAFHHISAVLLLDESVDSIDTDVLVLGDDREATDTVQAIAGLVPGMRGIYGGRLRNAGQVEAFTANLISMNRRYKAHAGVRITDV